MPLPITPATRSLIATAALALTSASCLAGCGAAHTATPAPAPSSATAAAPGHDDQLALDVLAKVVAGNDAAVTTSFDPGMRQHVSAEQLGRAWTAFGQQFGTYQSHGQPQNVSHNGLTVVNVPLTMTRKPGQFRIGFHPGGQISGLFFLPTEVPFPPS